LVNDKQMDLFGQPDLTEKEFFRKLQENFVPQYKVVFDDDMAPKTVVVIPSLTLDPVNLTKVEVILPI